MGVAASRTRTSDQDPDVGTGKQTSARPLTHESTALASVVPASPLDTPAIFIGPDQSSHFAIEASLVSPSLGATVLSSVPRVVPVDRPLEIELDHGPCSDVLAFESFARCLSSHALLSVCIATQGRALTYVSAPADVRLSSDGAWNLRALVHPASWTDADSVTVLSLTCAGRPLPCKGLPATIRVGYDNTPAPAGAVLAAAKAGDVLALQAALIAGGSTEEADERFRTGSWWAARIGHLEAVRTLLVAGASHAKSSNGPSTPLHQAALSGHAPIVALLLATPRVDPLALSSGYTPLDWAIWREKPAAAALLQADPRVAAALAAAAAEEASHG